MSIDNEQLVFAEGNDGMASTETVAVATMSNNTKRIIVVDDSNQVCSIDDNGQLVPVTVGSYSGPLRRDDVDQSGNGTITVADLASLDVTITTAASFTVTALTIGDYNVEKGQYLCNAMDVDTPVVLTGENLENANAQLKELNTGVVKAPDAVSSARIEWDSGNADAAYAVIIGGETWTTFIVTA